MEVHRRSLLAGIVGCVGGSFAGCVTFGGTAVDGDRLRWSTSLGVDPPSTDARDVAAVDGAVAAVAANHLFVVGPSGERRWDGLEYPSAVVAVDGGFLGVDWPRYHPRNAENTAVLTKVSPAGSVEWRTAAYALANGRGYAHADVAVGPERCYVLHGRGRRGPGTDRSSTAHVSAVALSYGTEVWTSPVDASTEVVRSTGDAVLAVGKDVVAYDGGTGALAWTTAAFETNFAPPAVDGDRIVLTSHEPPCRVRVVDAGSGRRVADYAIAGTLDPRGPLVAHDGVGLGTGYDGTDVVLFAVEVATGDARWRSVPEHPVSLDAPDRMAAFADGTAYLFGTDLVLRAIAVADGSVRWSFATRRNYPVLATVGSTVYVLAGGSVYALDATPAR